MRLYVSNAKKEIVPVVVDFLKLSLINLETKIVFNGTTYEGIINDISFDNEKFDYIIFKIDENELKFNFLEESKVRLDKGLFYFETKENTALIYT